MLLNIRSAALVTALLMLSACIPEPRTKHQGEIDLGPGGKVLSGKAQLQCTEPPPNYSEATRIALETALHLQTIDVGKLEAEFSKNVQEYSNQTQHGADLNHIFFYICQIGNNRGFSEETTKHFMTVAISSWTELSKLASRTKLEDKLVKEAFRITVQGDQIIAEKDMGKIVVRDRGSCLGKHPFIVKPGVEIEGGKWIRDEQGVLRLEGGHTRELGPPMEHRIYVEVLNLFSRPVTVMEHHVVSLIDMQKLRGYVYQPAELSAIKAGEAKTFTIYTWSPASTEVIDHLQKFDHAEYGLRGLTQAVILMTSEGILPAVPVRSITRSEKCSG